MELQPKDSHSSRPGDAPTPFNGATIDIHSVRVENPADGSLLSIMEMIENVMLEVSPGAAQ